MCFNYLMRYMGIDYGLKKIGVAVSDENAQMAFPKAVIVNDKNLIGEIEKICKNDNIGAIVLSESQNKNGKPNVIMGKITEFKTILENELGLPVFFQNESFTTVEARRYNDIENADASAAALILQRYLEQLTTNN